MQCDMQGINNYERKDSLDANNGHKNRLNCYHDWHVKKVNVRALQGRARIGG